MSIDLQPFDLEALSEIRATFWLGTIREGTHEGRALVLRFEGIYRIGSEGNPDARYMIAKGEAAVAASAPAALVIDFSGLDYQWGGLLEAVFDLGVQRNLPCAVVVGSACQAAISTLLFGEDGTSDVCEDEAVFDSLDDAWGYLERELARSGSTPLHDASRQGDLRSLQQLLAEGMDADPLEDDGCTPLHYAADGPVARALIEAGANVHARTDSGLTALHLARSPEVVRRLLEAGADPDARSDRNFSPLYHAKSAQTVRHLVKAGADVLARNQTTVLHTVTRADVALALIKSGAQLNARDPEEETPLDSAERSSKQFRSQAEQGFPKSTSVADEYEAIAKLLRKHGGKRSDEL